MRQRLVPRSLALAVFLLAAPVLSGAQEHLQRKRIAVLDFEDYSGSKVTASRVFGADIGDVGRGISAALIVKLKACDKYTVIDQSAIKTLLAEQNSSEEDHLDAYGRAAKFGRMLGLDAMVVGAITRFGPDEANRSSGLSGVGTRKSKAYVELTARLLGMTTGEVLAEFKASGTSVGSGEVMQIAGRGKAKNPQEILGNEFADSLLGEATRNAVAKIAEELDSFATKIPVPAAEIDALVADVEGNRITVNVGWKSGWRVGDKVTVSREQRAATDRNAAGAASTVAEQIGEATVTEVTDSYVSAVLETATAVKVGDRVRRTGTQQGP